MSESEVEKGGSFKSPVASTGGEAIPGGWKGFRKISAVGNYKACCRKWLLEIGRRETA